MEPGNNNEPNNITQIAAGATFPTPPNGEFLLEDDTNFLLEDGTNFLLED
jgi:hypothetical protein